MPRNRTKRINLKRFAAGTARLSPTYCKLVATACALKLQQHEHANPAQLSIEGTHDEVISVTWDEPDPRDEGGIGEKATEFAGECLGIVLSEKLTEFNVVERSRIGTGFDFWLGHKTDPLFQRKARLETSALDHGDNAAIEARCRNKRHQLQRGSHRAFGNAVIVVSQFQRPIAKVERHA